VISKKQNEKGKKETNNVFPFNLVIQGTKQVKNMYSDKFVTSHLPHLLSTIPSGTPLYNLWGEEPNKAPVFIGQIVLTSTFSSSHFGDKMLFFQHTRKEEDFALKPDWISVADEINTKQGNNLSLRIYCVVLRRMEEGSVLIKLRGYRKTKSSRNILLTTVLIYVCVFLLSLPFCTARTV